MDHVSKPPSQKAIVVIDDNEWERRDAAKVREWARFDEQWKESSNALSKLILFVGSGSFVLSMSFITGLLEEKTLAGSIILFASWGFLTVAIVGQALLHLLLMKYSDFVQEKLNKWTESGYRDEWRNGSDPEQVKRVNLIERVTVAVFIFFVLGVLTMLGFGIWNIVCTENSENGMPVSQCLVREPVKLCKQSTSK
ncbi:MAG TPA: hypothetical protein VNU25_02540 [Candidatus Paceibacterota bacterium]|nr:hypothetical protein [Candidatus Paceibacterota bacterium]